MRLIDADDLKKAIMLKEDVAYETWNELYDSVLEEIDNAPTIKTFTLLDIEENFNKGLNIGLSYAPEDRPQGKWIFKHNSSDIWCSICDENFDEIPQKFNYCPNCGAQMNGGEDHD